MFNSQHDMKRIFHNVSVYVLVAIATCLSACSDDSYPGLEYIPDDNDGPINNTESSDRDPIMVFVRDPFFININSTRSKGVYDPNDPLIQDWWVKKRKDSTRFYLYAFRENKEDNPPLNYEPNLKAHFSDDVPEHRDCLIDGTVNVPKTDVGLEVKLNDVGGVDGLIQDVKTEHGTTTLPLYYSTAYQQTGYTFSMYRIDEDFDYENHVNRESDKISFDVTFDGAQDIMCGVAPRLRDLKEIQDKLNYSEASLGGDYAQDLRNIADYGYSTYSAHRGLHPTILLSHCLTRLDFEAYPGDASADKIEITRVRVVTKNKGTLVVASRNPEEIGLTINQNSTDSLYLQQLSPDSTCMVPLTSLKVHFDPTLMKEHNKDDISPQWLDQSPVRMGESLLLPPDNSYQLIIDYIDYIEGLPEGDGLKLQAKYTITPPQVSSSSTTFQANWVYKIRVAVFGTEEIQVFSSVEAWHHEGGTQDVEPDFAPLRRCK